VNNSVHFKDIDVMFSFVKQFRERISGDTQSQFAMNVPVSGIPRSMIED